MITKGPTGSQGPSGSQGPTGSQGPSGSQGPTGPVGQNAAISSIFVWSDLSQNNVNVSKFQYVYFENSPIGPAGAGWSTFTDPSFAYPTAFIVPVSGFYLLTYKLDVRSGGGSLPLSSTDGSTVLTRNGNEIPGSSTLVEAPETNHIYTISNTVLVDLSFNDKISLLFWSGDAVTRIGDPSNLHLFSFKMPIIFIFARFGVFDRLYSFYVDDIQNHDDTILRKSCIYSIIYILNIVRLHNSSNYCNLYLSQYAKSNSGLIHPLLHALMVYVLH